MGMGEIFDGMNTLQFSIENEDRPHFRDLWLIFWTNSLQFKKIAIARLNCMQQAQV